MGALGHYLEAGGLATTQISLIRLHTEKIAPPRALWVPFELGRPFGAPHDARFQTRVLLAALRLLEAPKGPVLADFPEDAPDAQGSATDEEADGLVCPISLPGPSAGDGLAAALRREIAQLAPWYERAVAARGRTAFGVAGLAIEQVADHILGFLEGSPPPNPRSDLSDGELLKLACDDLKAYYVDAVAAQPGFGAREVSERWFWNETAAGKVFAALKERCAGSADKTLQAMSKNLLVPRTQIKDG